MNKPIYKNEKGFVAINSLGDMEVYANTVRDLDGWYESCMNHVLTIYQNGYVREQYLGKYYDTGLTDFEEQKIYAIQQLQ